MARHYPTIDLAGYQRLHDVERRIWYSPAAIVLALIGLCAAAYTFWGLSRGFVLAPQHMMVSYAVFLAAYGALAAYYHAYRFRLLKCPGCEQVMRPYITDLDDSPRLKFLQQVQIAGRYYRRPYDEDDHRLWVRLMIHIRGCPECKTFVNCYRLHLESCTEEELGQIRQRIAG